MFTSFWQCYEAFQQTGVENPLFETLRLFNILSQGALQGAETAVQQTGWDWSNLARKRAEGMPLEYVIGRSLFMGLELFCTPDALIPRPETELLVRAALDSIRQKQISTPYLTVVDMCTGSGNVAVALGVYSTNATLLACDISPSALEVARQNIHKFQLQERISLFCGDAFAPLHTVRYAGNVDLVVCNPPYVPTASLKKLPREILDYEPILALDAGAYGIDFYRRLIADSLGILKPGGVLLFEIGTGQEKLIGRLLERQSEYENICYFNDEKGIRVVSVVKRNRSDFCRHQDRDKHEVFQEV